MGQIAIRVEHLGKRYAVGTREPYRTLRDTLARTLSALARGRSEGGVRSLDAQQVWALRDVSFEINEGEVIGVIGRNAAGKSTLLRILSRITKPSTGYTETFGRVGSLLEVGTGFHPELTGRENVYLNGAIHGMGRSEIRQKFDEIVGFAEVEKFIDTPIKHYSSGMFVRLAFAVAAHLEPDILLVDEVLAVGDLEFQRKCLGKMGEVGRSGRTVLLVSHQMNQIRRLCSRSIWFDRGQVKRMGVTGDVIAAYEAEVLERGIGSPSGGGCFRGWKLGDEGNVLKDSHETVELRFSLCLERAVSLGHFGVAIQNDASMVIAGWGFDRVSLPAGMAEVSIVPRSLPIRPGTYSIIASLFDGGNNLTGGRPVEIWQASPPLIVDSIPLGSSTGRVGGRAQHTSGSDRQAGGWGALMTWLGSFLGKPAHEKFNAVRFEWMKRLASLPYCPVRYRIGTGAAEMAEFWWSYVLMSFVAGRSMLEFGGSDVGYLRLMWRLLRPGMIAMDIGAFHGLYSVIAAKRVEATGRVVAFEPSPRDRRRLRLHVVMNRLRNVTVEPYAVSGCAGEIEFYVVMRGFTTMNSLKRPATSDPVSRMVVDTVGLDAYCRNVGIERVDFLKVDVEGGELELFRGAQDVLTRARPVILCEVLDWVTRPWGYEASEIVQRLQVLGYEWFDVADDGSIRRHRQTECLS